MSGYVFHQDTEAVFEPQVPQQTGSTQATMMTCMHNPVTAHAAADKRDAFSSLAPEQPKRGYLTEDKHACDPKYG